MDLTKDRKTLKELYQPSRAAFSLVDVPALPFAMIDAEGSPDHGAGANVVKALFSAIYPIRTEARKRMGKSFVDAPLEMLFWADDMKDIAAGNRENWNWRAMITLPAWTDEEMFATAIETAAEHMEEVPTSLRMETLEEGRSVQIMHVGTADEIPALLEKLYQDFLPENQLAPTGAYHEIYLEDWSRTAPERRKIILRQPVQPL
ncbi:MAG: GyrI-like domain-containing protein [Parvularculaceae bacterium]